ncbi:MAG: hypothetical protein R3F37_01355 [Candidatus Competibacteraceae bacterium]
MICCKTLIGCGAPRKAGSADVHGAPLGSTKSPPPANISVGTTPPFEIPEEIYVGWDARSKGKAWEQEWNDLLRLTGKPIPIWPPSFCGVCKASCRHNGNKEPPPIFWNPRKKPRTFRPGRLLSARSTPMGRCCRNYWAGPRI